MKILSFGELLWDVFPDHESLGGAALNFSVNCRRLGHQCTLVTAVGKDPRGWRARKAMLDAGLCVELLQETSNHPTGIAEIEISANGEPQFRIKRPAAFDCVVLTDEILQQFANSNFDWLYFGTLMQTEPTAEAKIKRLANLSSSIRCFYDVNLRPGQWTLPLVRRLSSLASVIKLNEHEARMLSQSDNTPPDAFALEDFCSTWASEHSIDIVCVTRGNDGCYVYSRTESVSVAGFPATVHDTVGAGDAFSAAFLHGISESWPMLRTAQFANALGSLVVSRSGATPDWSIAECNLKKRFDAAT
jgi:fructokinase